MRDFIFNFAPIAWGNILFNSTRITAQLSCVGYQPSWDSSCRKLAQTVAPLVTNGVRLLSSGSTKLTTVKEWQQGWRKGVWDTKVSQKANLLTKKTSDMSKGSNKRKHRFPLSQQKPTHSKVSLLTIPEFRWETKEIFCCPKVFWKAHLRWEVCSYWIYSVFLNCMCRVVFNLNSILHLWTPGAFQLRYHHCRQSWAL